MQHDEIFIETNLPEPLEKEELYNCFNKMYQGDKEARDKIIKSNIRLVLSEVNKKFMNTNYELRELVSIGLIGLIKSVDSFDLTKGTVFSVYAVRCIDNEILVFLRKNRKYLNNISLEQPIGISKDNNELKVEDILMDPNSNFIVELENKELAKLLQKSIDKLSAKEKDIIIRYFGFTNKPISQAEIAREFGETKQNISRIVGKVLKKMRVQLENNRIYEAKIKEQIKIKEKKEYTIIDVNNKIIDMANHFLNSNLSLNEFAGIYCEFSANTLDKKFLNDLALFDPELAILVKERLNAKNPRLIRKKRQS